MGIFITENILSEGNLTATTANLSTISTNILSATTLYGNGSNLTNVSVTPLGVNGSVQFNNNGVLSGTTKLLYSGDTLFFTGTTRLSGPLYRTNSPSVKLIYQWGGSITAGVTPGIVWTNQPLASATWLGTTLTNDATYITDLTEYTQCRLFTSTQVSATTNSVLTVQYATTIAGAYSTLVSVPVGGFVNPTGVTRDSGWSGITSAANTLVYIRLVGSGGNGADDPRFSPPTLLIR